MFGSVTGVLFYSGWQLFFHAVNTGGILSSVTGMCETAILLVHVAQW